jgi:Fe-S-cluster containining protein
MCDDVLLNCEDCQHGYICCVSFRVPLAEDEVGKYPHDKSLAKKGIYTLVKDKHGNCIFFDEAARKCMNWEDRPRACREYDCRQDMRVVHLRSAQDVPNEAKFDDNIRVIVSVEVLNASDKRKISPMMVQTKDGLRASEVVEVAGPSDSVSQTVQEHVAVYILDRVSEMEAVCPRDE